MASKNNDDDRCAVCGNEAPKMCGKCKGVSYCGKACQLADWDSHGPTCELFLEHVPFCGVCNASQDVADLCFQCGFVFCRPCFDGERYCPGCSRGTRKASAVSCTNLKALKALVDRETSHPDKRRSFWYFFLGDLFEGGDMVQAKHYLNLSGSLGDGNGYNRLGIIYLDEGDWRKAKEFYEKGAALQCLASICNVGGCYSKGKFGGEIDSKLAKKWYKKGTRLGDAKCCVRLGEMYMLGQGIPKNKEKAICLFRRGAIQDAESQLWLGACYEHGKGVPRSLEQARYWFERAAAQGDEEARKRLAELDI